MGESTDKTSIGDRMKCFYEAPARTVLPGRTPVILRVDGKAFHSFTTHFTKPFDETLMTAMDRTAVALCEEVQGAQLAYIQSDEISVLIHGFKRFQSQPWFCNQVQKMVSVAASIATAQFSREMLTYTARLAHFDARVFAIPESEVCNYFLWRMQDTTRNSVQMLTRSLYSHKQVDGKDQSEMQEMCFQMGHNWNDLPVYQKRGRCVVRRDGKWVVDREPPIFKDDRNYVEKHLALEDES